MNGGAKIGKYLTSFFFSFTFCLETKSNKKFKATKTPPAQSDRLRNAILASKTVVLFFEIFYFSGTIFRSVSPQAFLNRFDFHAIPPRLVASLRTCAETSLYVYFKTF
jgi:hypothetical protein